MKSITFLLLSQLLIVNFTFSQSPFSILGKVGGQLIQDLSKKYEWKTIGKAIETGGEMIYEMEKIKASNEYKIAINNEIIPAQGYGWVDPNDPSNYKVKKITYENDKNIDPLENIIFYYQVGNWEKTIVNCDEFLQLNNSPEIYFIRANSYFILQKYSQALNDYLKVKENADNIIYKEYHGYLFGLIGICYFIDLNNCSRSIEYLSIAIPEISDNDIKSECLYYRAQCKHDKGWGESALEDLDEAMSLTPNDHDIISKKATYLFTSFFDEMNKLLSSSEEVKITNELADRANNIFELLKKALKLEPNNMYDLFMKGMMCVMNPNLKEDGCMMLKKAADLGHGGAFREWNKHCK